MLRLLLSFFVLVLALASGAHEALAAPSADLTPEQAVRELRLLERSLVALHPGLYRYRSPEQTDAEFAAAEAAVQHGAGIDTMYLLTSRLAASVRCGHTWTNPLNQSDAVKQSLFGRSDKLPLRLRVIERRFLVTASTDPQIRAGDELLAIDGRPAAALIAELLPYLRADGSSDGKRLSQIDSGVNGGAMDRLFPLLHPPLDNRYALALRRGDAAARTVSVAATGAAAREAALAAAGRAEPDEAWSLRYEGAVAVLTLPTFAFWHGGFDWHGFLAASFTEIAQRHVTRLVIDLRRNEGGDDAIGQALLSHLLREDFTPERGLAEVSFERVPYALARFLDTWDFGFFDHTGHTAPTAGRNLRLIDRDEGGRPIVPAAPHYRGRTVALVGPQMSSAGFVIARDLQRSHAAVLVGQPTGGNLRGLNGGQLAWLTLPNSGVAVDIPLVAWVPAEPQPDQSVLPDVAVPQRFEAMAAGIDVDMAAALDLLAVDSIQP